MRPPALYDTLARLAGDPFWSAIIGDSSGPEAVYAYAYLAGLPSSEAAELALADTARYVDPDSLSIISASLHEAAKPILSRAAIASGATGFYLVTSARQIADNPSLEPKDRLDALKFIAALVGKTALPSQIINNTTRIDASRISNTVTAEKAVVVNLEPDQVRALVSSSIRDALGPGGGGVQIPYLPASSLATEGDDDDTGADS